MKNVKILLVEDESIEALDIEHTLQSFGYEVPHVLSSGEDAIEKAFEIRPDLILMDIVLKGHKNGIEAASEIKKLNIPIIFLTAHSEESTIEKAKLTEPYAYIIKPYDRIELKYAIELALYKSNQEKKLKESEERYRMLFENSQVSTAITSMEGKVLEANGKFLEMVGSKAEEVHKIDLKTMYDDVRQRDIIIETLKRGDKVREYEVNLRRLDGQTYINSINVDLIRYQNNNAMLVTAINITDRKKAEKILMESEKCYRTLYSTMNEGVAIHKVIYDDNSTPIDYKILDVNPAYEKIFGINGGEILGKRASEIYDVTKAPYLDVYSEVAGTGSPKKFETYFKPMNKYFKISVFSLGKGFFGTVFEDVTARKIMEEKLVSSEERLSQIAENINEVFYMHDREKKKFIYVSPAFESIWGVPCQELCDDPYTFFYYVHPDDRDDLYHKMKQELEHEDEYINTEYRIIRPDGEIRWIWSRNFPVKTREGKTYRVAGIAEDITLRKKAELELMKSEERFKTVANFNYDWEYWVGPDGNLIYVSPSCERITGYTPEEFLDNSGLLETIMHPEDIEIFGKHLREESTTEEHTDIIRYRIIDKNGGEKWIAHGCQPVYNSKGEFSGRRASNRDITERKKAEIALRESEERNRSLVENAGLGIGYYDLDGKIIMYNKIASAYFGGKPEDFEGKTLFELFDEELASVYMGRIERSIHSEESQVYEDFVPLPREDKWFLSTYTKIKDFKGTIIGVQIISNDITIRKNMEIALRDSEEFLDSIVENIPNMIFIKNANDLSFKMVNKAGEELLGYSREDLIGKNDYDFFPKNEADFFTRNDREVLQKKELLDIPEETIETRDFGQRIMHTKKIPLMDLEGNPQYLLGISEDITELKQAERELKASEGFLRGLFDNMPSGMAAYQVKNKGSRGSDYVIKEFNKISQKIEGMSRKDVIGKSLHDIRPSIDDYGLIPIFKKVWETGKPIHYPAKIYVDDKYANWYENYVFKAQTGEVIAIYNDVTEQQISREKIKKSLKEKEVLLREIHHRVKNNMQIISSLLSLQNQFTDDEEVGNVLKESQNRVKSMAMIYDRLYQSPDLTTINISEYIERLVADLSYSYSPHQNVKSVVEVDDLMLNLDTAVPCGLIISELVSNGFKYAFPFKRKGKLTVSLKKVDEHNELVINDDGVGLPPGVDFEKADTLGFQLVNNLVKQIDGEIKLDKCRGTNFKIKFKELKYKERLGFENGL